MTLRTGGGTPPLPLIWEKWIPYFLEQTPGRSFNFGQKGDGGGGGRLLVGGRFTEGALIKLAHW